MKVRIDTEKIFSEFNQHFYQENNDRILFSSQFGTGKSTFLTEYFEKNTDFNVFKIYPVSYSVADNEDIFELIKFDVLFQLFERADNNEISLIDEDYSQVLAYQFKFLTEMKFTSILFKLIEYADKTGASKAVNSVIENMKEQYEKFKSKDKNEEQEILNFLLKQYSKSGSPRENDLITQLISKLLKRLIGNEEDITELIKNDDDQEAVNQNREENEKQNVLIIDDLDRLDPEHIFRLFNVFSVNFGKDEIQNKFGFDKIIFVCDLDNIRKIYEHRYGKGVDFEGYIDKFYSSHPFKFDSNQFLNNYITELVQLFKIPLNYIDFSNEEFKYSPNYILINTILKTLISSKKINLRTLLNVKFFNFEEQFISFTPKRKYNTGDFPILKLFKILEVFFDSRDLVYDILQDLSKNFNKNSFANLNKLGNWDDDDGFFVLVDMCIPFITDIEEYEMIVNDVRAFENKNQILKISELNASIHFRVEKTYSRNIKTIFKFLKFSTPENPEDDISINPFKILLIAYNTARKLKMF